MLPRHALSTLLERFLGHGRPDDPAVVEERAGGALHTVSHAQLRAGAAAIADTLRAGRPSLGGARVAFLIGPGASYVETMLGIFLAGGTAVPLSPLHPPAELGHIIATASPERLLASPDLTSRLHGLPSPAPAPSSLLSVTPSSITTATASDPLTPGDGDPALMLFTSGTTGKPKGVTMSHGALAATLAALEQAWGWRRDDRLLHVLPLHHTHGVVVALFGALWAGAATRFAPFDGARVWELFAGSTVFMAVPTIYAKLMEAFRTAAAAQQAAWQSSARAMRLLTSGSAALPAALFREFEAASGQPLLERYGMTEIGMALSNPLAGPRIAGAVGRELPGVTVDVVDDDGRALDADQPGELRVRSPQMFSGYHGDPEATARSFDDQGRFRTGDTGLRDGAGVVRLLGRTSTDILKSGGYKLSALEIEAVLRDHPAVAEVAVIGLPDQTWGDRVTACAVLRPGAALTLAELREFARDRLASYKLPRELRLLDALPRTALGKVQKGLLKS
ncbi:MAG TPA: acyl-CoA synthetase [Polyangia bacterium]|nr:acyl-CoA synthetase [Polyangia bacterium]